MVETALRRPRALREAVTLALMHKHLYEYMRDTCARLDELVDELRRVRVRETSALETGPA